MILLIKYSYIAMLVNGNFLSKKFGKKVLAGNTDFKNSLNRKRWYSTNLSAAEGSFCLSPRCSSLSLTAKKPEISLVLHSQKSQMSFSHLSTVSIREYDRQQSERCCTSIHVSSAFFDDVSAREFFFFDDVSTRAFSSFVGRPRLFPGEACWNTSNNNERNVLQCQRFPCFYFFFFFIFFLFLSFVSHFQFCFVFFAFFPFFFDFVKLSIVCFFGTAFFSILVRFRSLTVYSWSVSVSAV